MKSQPDPAIQLLRAAYAAFNSRNVGAALALMAANVTWPKAFKGGFAHGPDEIRAYWTEQWKEIDPHVEPIGFYPQDASHVLVHVHQVVRDLSGSEIADERVGHRFTIDDGLIRAMEICLLPSCGPQT
jgi:SnoaL-like protein